ncbi:MAG: type IV secretory system conjugative DNA transfer family protein [Thermoanaerobaculia bacterium]
MSAQPSYRLTPGGGLTAKGVVARGLAAVVGVATLTAWALTQRAAIRLGFHAALGRPWIPALDGHEATLNIAAWALWGAALLLLAPKRTRLLAPIAAVLGAGAFAWSLGPLFTPFHLFVWAHRLGSTAAAHQFWRSAFLALGLTTAACAVVAAIVVIVAIKRLDPGSDLHGSARWATEREARNAGLFAEKGLILGQWPGRKDRILRHDGPEHIFVFAPTRSGKGVSLVVPNLLTWPHSVLVHDMKGENWVLSAGWRSRELGSLCLKFDPTCSDGSGARYNPLLEIRMGDQEVRDAQNVADILVDPNGDRIRDHWDRTAHSLLVGLILHVLYAEKEKTLAGCAHFLARPDRPIDLSLEVLLATEHAPPGHPGWRDPVTGESLRTHPTVAAAARALMDKSPNERSGVLSTALSFLDLYRDPILAQNTAVSDFALEDLVSHESPVSLYLTVPPSDLSRTRPLVRLLLNQACRRLTERMDFSEGRGRGAGKHPLLLMLDEFPALGKLQFFQESLAYLAGYDIRAMLITQDLSQHQGVYGKQESITANCHVRIAFAANKPETAELLSQMAGDTTVSHKQVSYRGGSLMMGDRNTTQQEIRRRLLTPDEAMRLDPDHEVVFVAGQQPMYAGKSRYFQDRELSRRANLAAPASSGRTGRSATAWGALQPASSTVPLAASHAGELSSLASVLDRERGPADAVDRQV